METETTTTRTAHYCADCGRLTSTVGGRVERHTNYLLLPAAVTCLASGEVAR